MAHFAQPDRQKRQLDTQGQEQGGVESLEPQREIQVCRGTVCGFSPQHDTTLWIDRSSSLAWRVVHGGIR